MITSINNGVGSYLVLDHVTNIPYKCKGKAERDAKIAELKAKYNQEAEEVKTAEAPQTPAEDAKP